MSSVETTELKLKTTPTGGVDASQSPYYRRLLSAGYKGYLQGTIGGASLYGVIGLAIGTLVAVPLLLSPLGLAALALIPAAAGVGIVKGATTFGNIGSTAATLAESADLTEQRRYLLDRYYDLPEGPEGDREAEAIKKELMRQHDSANEVPEFFHWKTVAVCAAIGAAIALTLCSPIGVALFAGSPVMHVFGALGIEGTGIALSGLGTAVGAAMGALAGAVIGIDRYYIRKWFDHTQNIVHASSHTQSALIERSEQIGRLKEAARADEQTKSEISDLSEKAPVVEKTPAVEKPPTPAPATPASLDATPQIAATPRVEEKPATKISQATLDKRLADIQAAMEVPAL